MKGCPSGFLGAIVPEDGGASKVEVHSEEIWLEGGTSRQVLTGSVPVQNRSSPAWKQSSLEASLPTNLGEHVKGYFVISQNL